jgi:RNA polymerase sigma-70 factor (ECF subfamily)
MSLAQRLEAVYRQERQRLFACAFAVLGEADAAEDAVHSAFERLLSRSVEPDNLLSYVLQTVRNCAHDIGRRNATADRLVRGASPARNRECCASEPLEDQETEEQLVSALLTLDPPRREIIELHLRADLKFREIAAMLELPLGTVTSHYRRGIEQLRRLLSEDEEDEREEAHDQNRTTHP